MSGGLAALAAGVAASSTPGASASRPSGDDRPPRPTNPGECYDDIAGARAAGRAAAGARGVSENARREPLIRSFRAGVYAVASR
jgi:hypothetical protein